MGMRSFEFDLDLASDGQVGGGKKTNSAFAKTDAAAIDDSRVSRVIDLDPHRGVKGKPLPAAPIYRLLHSIPTSRTLFGGECVPRRRTPDPVASQSRRYSTVPIRESYRSTTNRTMTSLTYRLTIRTNFFSAEFFVHGEDSAQSTSMSGQFCTVL